MELIVLSKGRCKSKRVTLSSYSLLMVCLTVVAVGSIVFGLGAHYAMVHSASVLASQYETAVKLRNQEIEHQRAMINQAQTQASDNLDALASRLSKLQSHIMRLDALGSRLATMANLEDIDFSAGRAPGMGGPSPIRQQNSLQVMDFISELEQLSLEIEDRGEKLKAMESMLIDRTLQDQTLPGGRPVSGGWVSSTFGWRADPLKGKREFHEGVDFASKSGSKVAAVGAGIVTWSGKRYGYGYMVEINHGNGYVTRYAHNKKNLVTVGEKVEKGQAIAVIGSTGRSTGTHIHFEVVHNGKQVNPKKYFSVN
jgi:murein DD-endopeptidase MepM/ murein hydrolase activator NlpD